MLEVWPPLPIVIEHSYAKWDDDNIIAALEHNNRICYLVLWYTSNSQFEKVLAAMQRPFPALTNLQLGFKNETAPVDPGLFLGGSAPGLQSLYLHHIPFPRLPKLLLSATHLVRLGLSKIPPSGYISPDAMATSLSVLTRLETLTIGFESPRSCPDRRNRRPPPRTRTLLPVLTHLFFNGVSEYLEDFLARIDGPLLKGLWIKFFHQLTFDTPLPTPLPTQFIYRTPNFGETRVHFRDSCVCVTTETSDVKLNLEISCSQSDWQVSSLAQVCSSSFLRTLIPAVEYLYFEDGYVLPRWQDDIESCQWLELLHPFTTVRGLYISGEFVPRIVPALQELTGERVTEVLPALQTLFLGDPHPSGPVQEVIGQFVGARQLAGHPIAVSHWEEDEEDEEDEDS
jgi:hypothetical protein